MLTDNERIAKFMGLEFKKEIDGIKYYRVPVGHTASYNASMGQFYYHKSWDWLMPVVKKITNTKPMNQAWYDVKYHLIEGNIDVVYERVVSFIKWFETREGAEE